MTLRIMMTGEDGLHNMGDEGQALASAARLRRYFPEAGLVSTGLDPRGAVLRSVGEVVPWPVVLGDMQQPYAIRLARKVARKLGGTEGLFDPAGRRMPAIFDEQYRSNPRFRVALAEIERASFIFDMGHGALNDVFDPFMLCFLYYLAGRLGKPLFISGQSIGPLWRDRSVRMVRECLRFAHTVCLRDKDVSLNCVTRQLGLDRDSVRVVEVGDDTLDLIPEEPDWDGFAPQVADVLRSGEFFAVQWRASDYTHRVGDAESLIPLARAVTEMISATGLPAVFLPFSWEPGSSDVFAALSMQDVMQGASRFHIVWHCLRAPELKWLLGHSRFGIGLSYHFHVFLLSQGRPSIGLFTNSYYQVKLQGAFAAYDCPVAPLHYPDDIVDAQMVNATLDRVLQWSDADRGRGVEAAANSRDRWHQAFRAFISESALC